MSAGSWPVGIWPTGTFIQALTETTKKAEAPVDVGSYAKASRTFPHETTADQWFSESQFESYRALGAALADAALDGAGADFAARLAALSSP